jgi:hypothetical protein
MEGPGYYRWLQNLFCSSLHCVFAGEVKWSKKKNWKTAFQWAGHHLLVHSTQASRADRCYKKII